ncbi:hypothetical protein GINT2_000535 [Glugoides intestinalis]
MNNNILFELSKYLINETGLEPVDEAYRSPEVLKQYKNNVSDFLNSKLCTRPTKKELEMKNIIRKHSLDFDYIHTLLESIDFRDGCRKISPRIANIAKRIDFNLKRKLIMHKLGLTNEKW